MGSKSVSKVVAKKLKYYVDVKRREDAFDLSGPYQPTQEPCPKRPGPTLAYDGLHDRSLKHYFHNVKVKGQVTKMLVPSMSSFREIKIRRALDVEMSKRDYKLSASTQSPYMNSGRKPQTLPRDRPQALISVDEYLQTKRGSTQRKHKANIVGKPRNVERRSPPQFVGKNEHVRLVNTAARLLAATEKAALPGNRYQQTTETSTNENSQFDIQSYTGESTDTDSRRHARLPSRGGFSAPRWTPPRGSPLVNYGANNKRKNSKSSSNSVKSDTSATISHLNQRKTLKKKETTSTLRSRPLTADVIARGPRLESSIRHTSSRPRSEPVKNNSSFIKALTYKVYVFTGDYEGAGTKADIRLTVFGEYGSSGERLLLLSMNHSRKFRRGQVDIFHLDSVYLGDLENIRIGHSKTSPEYGWYLEKIYITDAGNEEEPGVFEFQCKRWFSSQKDDGQILRDISVSGLVSVSELNRIINDYGKHAPSSNDEESSTSYSSSSSGDERHDDEGSGKEHAITQEGRRSSDEEETNKKHESGKKMVSFRGEKTKEKWKHGVENWKTRKPVKIESERSHNSSEISESENSTEDDEKYSSEGTDDGSLKTKFAEVRRPEEGTKTESSNSQNAKVESTKEDDDFWSVKSDKNEPIYHDLGVEKKKKLELEMNSALPIFESSSRQSSPSSSDLDDLTDENELAQGRSELKKETDKSKWYEDDSGSKKEGEMTAKDDSKNDESNKDYMAGFMAGVRASEDEKEPVEKTAKDDTSERESGVDDEDDEEEFVSKKDSSLHFAVSIGNLDRVRMLIQHDPSLKDQTDEKGWIPLHIACSRGQLECVKLLATFSDHNLEQETPTGYTSMHLAAMNGHVNCMMVLYALGAGISCRTIDEYTPLHLAAMSGHVECVKWLLANRAKHDVTDVNGRTPGDIAEEYCYDDVANFLKLFKNELKKHDSTLSHLMTYEGRRQKKTELTADEGESGPSRAIDKITGGSANREKNWISDDDLEDNETGDSNGISDKRLVTGSRPASARRSGASRTDNGVASSSKRDTATKEEKQKMYENQRQKMKKRNSSFLDSIRMDVEDEFF